MNYMCGTQYFKRGMGGYLHTYDWLVAWAMVCGVLVLVGSGAAQWRRSGTDVVVTLPMAQVNWTVGVVHSLGRARSLGRHATASSPPATAYSQAAREARQRLLQTLTQLRFDADQTIGSILQGAEHRRQAFETLVREAEVVQTRYQARGTVESTVQLSLFGPLTALLFPGRLVTPTQLEPESEAVYTGIIIDARGLAMQPALFPRIVDEEGRSIYDPAVVDAEFATGRGYIAYTSALAAAPARSRIGEHPLVVRARRVRGEARVDLVLSRADAAHIQGHDGTRRLLQQCRVIIAR